VETVFARLAPLEARLAGLEAGDPRVVLDRFAERLEAVQGRLAVLEAPGENSFAEISEQLTRLYAQKDATVETVFARLAPLEARLGAIEAGVAGSLPRLTALEAADPRAELAEIAGRLAALQEAQGAASERLAALQEAAGDTQPFAEIADQLARMHAQRDAAAEAVAGRIAPLEARIAELEARHDDTGAEAARAEAEEIAAQMLALRAAAAQTELFADRLALLEASLPRLSAAQALMLQALERQGVPLPRREPAADLPAAAAEQPGPAPEVEVVVQRAPAHGAADAVAGTFPDLPRVISLHRL
jgi:chromosome segregation ATPase